MSLYTDPRFQAFMGQTWRPGGEALTRHGVELCAWPSGALVADVGCGPGGTSRLLRDMGCRVLAFDRTVADEVRDAGIIVADACALPVPDTALDGLVCECVLSLLPNPERAVREWSRVLRSCGRALISDVTALNVNARAGRMESVPTTASSCTDGALDPQRVSDWFGRAGLRLLVVEDHRRAMRELAAQLMWRGIGCGCGKAFGYQLWIVEKTGEPNHA